MYGLSTGSSVIKVFFLYIYIDIYVYRYIIYTLYFNAVEDHALKRCLLHSETTTRCVQVYKKGKIRKVIDRRIFCSSQEFISFDLLFGHVDMFLAATFGMLDHYVQRLAMAASCWCTNGRKDNETPKHRDDGRLATGHLANGENEIKAFGPRQTAYTDSSQNGYG